MLIECPECKRQVSDQAERCPHCGHPLKSLKAPMVTAKVQRAPVFVILAAIAFVLSLVTPRLLLTFPLMLTFACAVISLFRKEKGRIGAAVVFVLAIGLLLANETITTSSTSGTSARNLESAEITDWNWIKDPTFGTKGTIKWNVQVRNKSSRNIRSVKVEFTTFDREGKLVATTFTFVDAIPSGQMRAANSFADFYRTEQRATVRISDVMFAE